MPFSDHYLLIAFIALIFSSFFSGMETAFIASSRLKMELEKTQKLFSSKIITHFRAHPTSFLAAMLLGHIISLAVFSIAFYSLAIIFYNGLHIRAAILSVPLTIIFATAVILLVPEFLPKAFFHVHPNAALRIFAAPAFITYLLLFPVTILIIRATDFVIRYLPGKKSGISSEAFGPIFGSMDPGKFMNESQDNTERHEEEAEVKIFQNVLELSYLKVRDCMIPRTEITAVEFKTPVKDLINKFIETGYSKILLYRDSIDNMIGYVSSKELFKGPETIKSRLVPLSVVPESMLVNKLFRLLIKEHKSIALVVDEYGGTSGIITLEDIMEEIFGEIEDEHDTSEFIEKQVNENEYIFSGRLEIDYLNEKYKLSLPDSDEYDTLAGFIIFNYGDIPKVNSKMKSGNYEIRILKVSQTRIELVNLVILS